MKNLLCPFIIVFFSFSGPLISQDSVMVLDQVYGLDQTLCNGKIYNYKPPPGVRGHQYFLSPAYSTGSVTLKGKCFQGISLNYDLFNQQLLLLYTDEKGAMNIIEVSKAWLESFRLGNMNFEFLDLEQAPRFFQTLGEGPVRILYYWRKTLDVEGSIGSYYLTFSHVIRDTYVFKDGQLKPFSTKRTLIRLFDPGHRSEIKSYLRKNKINVKKSSDQVMAKMITFLGELR